MLPLAHIGITIATVQAAEAILKSTRVDYRVLLAASVLPDLIDKPLAYLLGGSFSHRSFGHSLGFLVLLCFLVVCQSNEKSRSILLTLAVGTASHDILDAMWRHLHIFFWPFYGLGVSGPMYEAWTGIIRIGIYSFRRLRVLEVVGGILLIRFVTQLFLNKGVSRFLKYGIAHFDKSGGKLF